MTSPERMHTFVHKVQEREGLVNKKVEKMMQQLIANPSYAANGELYEAAVNEWYEKLKPEYDEVMPTIEQFQVFMHTVGTPRANGSTTPAIKCGSIPDFFVLYSILVNRDHAIAITEHELQHYYTHKKYGNKSVELVIYLAKNGEDFDVIPAVNLPPSPQKARERRIQYKSLRAVTRTSDGDEISLQRYYAYRSSTFRNRHQH